MIYAFIIILIALIGLQTEKKLFNPITIFCGLWGSILFLSNLHLYGLNITKLETYIIFFVGILFFVLGFYLMKVLIGKKNIILSTQKKGKIYINKLNYTAIYLVAILCIPFYIKDLFSIVSYIGWSIDLKAVQSLLHNTDSVFVRSSIENFLRFFIVNPFVGWMCVPLLATIFWYGKRDKILIGILSSLVLLRMLSTGGRATVIQLFFSFICVYTFHVKNDKTKQSLKIKQRIKKNKKIFVFVTLFLAVFLIAITYSRAGQSALKTIYFDFAMQPLMFESWADTVDKSGLLSNGIASLNGFLYPIDYILRNTLGLGFPDIFQRTSDLINATDTTWIWIGPTIRANAYVSIFWFFYVDARMLGVIIGCFLYGAYSKISYNWLYKREDEKSIGLYCIVILGIFYTFGRLQFSQSSYVLGMIYMSLFMFKKEIRPINWNKKGNLDTDG